ncbi:single-stranded-DNA-specific exonuclease RecJ [Lacunimicrobium album]
MPRIWRFTPHDSGRVQSLSSELRCSSLLAKVLLSRGYDSKDNASLFLSAKLTDLHDPELLPGCGEAADRIIAALNAGRKITIYGDYDVDGVTSTTILWQCLKRVGGNVDYYIPCRMEEGYGLNEEAIRTLHEQDPNQLVVSVDCGITSVGVARVARELNFELIITDHHLFGSELPDAAVLVHPRLPGSNYPFGELCGAGVAFKLAWAICQRLGEGRKASPRMREFLKDAVAFCALGTVADVVPLVGENRALVRYGLATLKEHSSIGLQSLMAAAEIRNKAEFTTDDIGFALAPRINAAGRLGQARLAVELLTTDNPERALQLAQYLDQLNKQRQQVERKILKRAKELVEEHPEWQDAPGLVLADPDWHPGVIGIVASRVAEHFEKPTILIAIDEAKQSGQGSGRTWARCDLHATIKPVSEGLLSFGGHQAAIGLKIPADHIDDFRTAFCNSLMTTHMSQGEPQVELRIDAEVSLQDLTQRSVTELDQLGPFGNANERPVFSATGITLAEPPKKIGNGERHLSVKFSWQQKTIRAIAFGKADWADQMNETKGPMAITFAPIINTFRGYSSVELQLIDWKPAEA